MANVVEIKVPDIGDFKDVPVIEVFVKPGDTVAKEQALVTLESDKATMEVPSTHAGVVKEVKVKLGDKISEGTVILSLETTDAAGGAPPKEKVKEGAAPTGEGAPVADYGAASGVYETVDVRVPDIGDFKDVPVIEVFVNSGDKVAKEQALVTLESDKATMEVPSPMAGTVKEVKIKLGDKVSEGSVILTLSTGVAAGAPAAPPAPSAAPAAPIPAPTAAKFAGGADIECEMVVLGAGPGGYSAAFRSADLGMKTVLDRALSDAGGRLPQRRLHSLEGAAAHGGRDGRGGCDGTPRHYVCSAADRYQQAAWLQGGRRQEADRRPGGYGEGPQGRDRARGRAIPRP